MKRQRIRTVAAAVAVVLGACGGVTHRTSPAVAPSGPTLPPVVAAWLRHENATSGIGHGTSADWVLTTREDGAQLFSGAIIHDRSPVYLFDVHGHFMWDHSCPPGAPRSACVSVGEHEQFTFDPKRMEIEDFGIDGRGASLAKLGAVGHVSL